jgi:UDP-N-acetyl-D-mannosaminuronate dehydrogenase
VDTFSPTYALRDELQRLGAQVTIEDPYYTEDELHNAGFKLGNIDVALVVVLSTAHKEFADPDFAVWRKAGVEVILDGRNFWSQHEAEAAGMLYFGIGRSSHAERTRLKTDPKVNPPIGMTDIIVQ